MSPSARCGHCPARSTPRDRPHDPTLPLPRSRVPAARAGATIAASRRAKGDAHYSPTAGSRVDHWLAGYLAGTVFANRDFTELRDGEVRLTHPLNAHLAHTAALWRKLAEPVADWLRDAFLRAVYSPGKPGGHCDAGRVLEPPGFSKATRMAGAVPRLKPLAPLLPLLTGSPSAPHDGTVVSACRECGRALPRSSTISRRRVFCSRSCAADNRRARLAASRLD